MMQDDAEKVYSAAEKKTAECEMRNSASVFVVSLFLALNFLLSVIVQDRVSTDQKPRLLSRNQLYPKTSPLLDLPNFR